MEQTNTCQRGRGRGNWMKKSERISQTYMHNSQIQTTLWGQREGDTREWVEAGKGSGSGRWEWGHLH